MPGNVAGVLLAAGEGSRLGEPKAQIVIGGQSLARRGIVMLQDGGADPVIVVTGATGPELPDVSGVGSSSGDTGLAGVITVHNPAWRTGMGSSLAAGLRAVPAACTAAVLALADQPLVGQEAVRRIIGAHADGAGVVVACYAGRPRNPVLIAREHWAEVLQLAAGDVGARPFLAARAELVTLVECGDTGRPDDIDTPEDLARIKGLLAGSASFPS